MNVKSREWQTAAVAGGCHDESMRDDAMMGSVRFWGGEVRAECMWRTRLVNWARCCERCECCENAGEQTDRVAK